MHPNLSREHKLRKPGAPPFPPRMGAWVGKYRGPPWRTGQLWLVATQSEKTSRKIHPNVVPRMAWGRKEAEEIGMRLVGGLAPVADGAGEDECAGILLLCGPPETPPHQRDCALYPRVAGQTGGVCPLQDLGVDRVKRQTNGNQDYYWSCWVTWTALIVLSILQITAATTQVGGMTGSGTAGLVSRE